ncbi:MAG: hypothetical protein K9L30_17280 [Desulfobacterales bacterium]|nr:hypothetical protein [Desulfobacterales bacterium]
MKIDSTKLKQGIKAGKIQLVDIRFKEAFEAWCMGFGTNIPLNELPERLNELSKDKTVVTACPHKDRAINAKYLTDGLVRLAENLRGDNAWVFID